MRAYKHLTFLFVFLPGLLSVFAQEKRFVYIQSDQQQSFYVRNGNQIYSSTDAGYVVIPDISQGVFNFTIGFPKNAWSSISYSIEIGQNDRGFRLNKVDSSSWVLYDFQTSTYLNTKTGTTEIATAAVKDTDDFTKVLAEVSNASLVQQQNSSVITSGKTIIDSADIKSKIRELADSSIVNASNKEAEIPEHIDKAIDQQTDSGRVMKYVISKGKVVEEVTLLIPKHSADAKPLEIVKDTVLQKDSTLKNKDIEKDSDVVKNIIERPDTASTRQNSTVKKCSTAAGDKEFLALRRNMVQEDTEAGMLTVCGTAFQSTCFTKDQIRNLGVLFLNEENRLAFLKTAYVSCFDITHYDTLLDLLSNKDKADELRALIQ
jgi:hypothetical protein